tara:strand:- start:760 stop:1137 length:378 start_codon:yes stop_codon:yes gene_type:complete
MAVQNLTHKKIIKYDTKNPNFKHTPKPEKVVNGNVLEEDVYGEKKHTYVPDANGNLQMEQLMGKVLNKLDNIPGVSQTGTKAVEVDIKREIAIGKVDASAVQSEVINKEVITKKDKLRALRNRRR